MRRTMRLSGYQERSEPEREAFKEKLSKIPKKRRVYVDEAGFDNRESYPYGYSPKGGKMLRFKMWKKEGKKQLD